MRSPSNGAESLADPALDAPGNGLASPPLAGHAGWRPASRQNWRLPLALQRFRFVILAYLGSRVLLLLVAILDDALRHQSLINEFQNWDGGWYQGLANQGYQHHALHAQTTLGFFPLYPLVLWVVSRPLLLTTHPGSQAVVVAGIIVSGIGGLIAAVLVQRLASGWWGEAAGRRAGVLFCLFPGSVVFSMVYAEGIMIPLALGCILALQDRRWLLAGALAAFATAAEPEAVILVPVCAVSAGLELRRRGWRSRAARRSLVAPLLAPVGVISVIAFLWAWTGTPLAYWIAQHYGWKERFDPLALVHLAIRLAHHISFAHFNHPTINLNWPVGLVGALVLGVLLVLMFRIRGTISIEAWIWTLGISFLAVTSEWVPPNPRLLITAFPAVMVLGYYLRRWAFAWIALANGALLAGMSALTFVSITLRP